MHEGGWVWDTTENGEDGGKLEACAKSKGI